MYFQFLTNYVKFLTTEYALIQTPICECIINKANKCTYNYVHKILPLYNFNLNKTTITGATRLRWVIFGANINMISCKGIPKSRCLNYLKNIWKTSEYYFKEKHRK